MPQECNYKPQVLLYTPVAIEKGKEESSVQWRSEQISQVYRLICLLSTYNTCGPNR